MWVSGLYQFFAKEPILKGVREFKSRHFRHFVIGAKYDFERMPAGHESEGLTPFYYTTVFSPACLASIKKG